MALTQQSTAKPIRPISARPKRRLFRSFRRMSTGEIIFMVITMIVLTIVGLSMLYPFLYTLTISLSTSQEATMTGGVMGLHLYPHKLCFDAYKLVFSTPEIMRAFFNTTVRTILGTAVTVLLTCMTAYALTFRELPHRALIIFLLIFSMIFSGGLVPGYLLVRNLGLINTVWSLIIPGAISTFNVLIMKSFFQQIPSSFRESASLDGASDWKILFRIYMPLSTAVIATITLWTAVGHWNDWFGPMLFITDDHRQMLPMLLQRIVINGNQTLFNAGMHDMTHFTQLTVQSATVIVTILPMIILYPFMQKYFVKGITLGGIKE